MGLAPNTIFLQDTCPAIHRVNTAIERSTAGSIILSTGSAHPVIRIFFQFRNQHDVSQSLPSETPLEKQ